MLLKSSIVGFCFAVTPFIKKEIMRLINKEEMFLYSNIVSLLFLLIINQKKISYSEINCRTIFLIFLISFISYYYNYTLNDLLTKFNPSKVMIIIKSFETLFLFILSSQNYSLKNMISVLIILSGSYIYNL